MKMMNTKKQLSKAMIGGLLLTSCIAKTSTESDNSSRCLSSSSTLISKSFVGYWSDKKNTNTDLLLEIGKNGELSFIYDNSWNDSGIEQPKTLGFLQSKSETEASFKPSCEYLEYEKKSGKSEDEINKDLEMMSKYSAKIENNLLVTNSPDSQEIYQRLDTEAALSIKEKIKNNYEKIQQILNTQIKPLIGKKFRLSKVTYVIIDQDGKSSTYSQEANQISEEYTCGNTDKPKTCYNAKTIEFLSLKESLLNGKLKAFNQAYLKNPQFNLSSDGIAIAIKEDEKTRLWLVSGSLTTSENTLTFSSTSKSSDGKTYSTTRSYLSY